METILVVVEDLWYARVLIAKLICYQAPPPRQQRIVGVFGASREDSPLIFLLFLMLLAILAQSVAQWYNHCTC